MKQYSSRHRKIVFSSGFRDCSSQALPRKNIGQGCKSEQWKANKRIFCQIRAWLATTFDGLPAVAYYSATSTKPVFPARGALATRLLTRIHVNESDVLRFLLLALSIQQIHATKHHSRRACRRCMEQRRLLQAPLSGPLSVSEAAPGGACSDKISSNSEQN